MQRQRDGLIPIGDAVSDLDDVWVPALRNDSPQARHSFTVADQVHQLVSADQAEPDRGFMARTMALCSLPRTNPGNRLQYKRVGIVKLTGCRAASRPIEYSGVVLLTISCGCLSL